MEKGLSPAHGVSRPISPLKSPLLRRHFAPIETNIHYPIKLISTKPVYKHLLICEDGKFRGSVDVHDYRPEEIKVKTIGHTILIELKHDEKDDGFGVVTRSFSKKFILPLTMDMAKISSWTSNGVLYLKVPPSESEQVERFIEIKHDAPTTV